MEFIIGLFIVLTFLGAISGGLTGYTGENK
jgi:hypothetical protein